MCRFARTVAVRIPHLLHNILERQLGPGTADLALRMGVHSGPVTAGVLRGQKARFQVSTKVSVCKVSSDLIRSYLEIL